MNPIKADMLKRKIKTQAEYAKLLGLSYSQVFRLATGESKIGRQMLMLMQLDTDVLKSINVS